jgi:periplasmic protein TonB
MTEHVMGRPSLDDPWGRLIWIVPAALALWIVLIAAFSMVLGEREAPPPPALEAQLVELPPPPPPIAVGLKGGGAKPAAPLLHKLVTRPARIHHAHPAPKVVPHENAAKVALPTETTTPSASAGSEANPAGASEGTEGGAASGSEGGEGSGGSGGIGGSDSGGARAIVAPTPVIPDDLREDAMSAVALARFTVTADGGVHVTLLKPTPNPRLNQILLDTLAKWQFFPAVRNGEPVDSTIDIRIPVTVQ